MINCYEFKTNHLGIAIPIEAGNSLLKTLLEKPYYDFDDR